MDQTQLLSNEQVRHKISEIISGKRLVVVRDKKGVYETLMFHIPSHEIKLESDLLYDQVRINALMDGIPSREDMKKQVEQFGMIDYPRIEAEETSLREKIKSLDNIILRSRSRHQILQKEKEKAVIERQLSRVLHEKNAPFLHTAEAKAEQSRTLFMIVNGIYTTKSTMRWVNTDAFLMDSNYDLQSELIGQYLDYAEGMSVKEIRFIARNMEWKIYWKACKNTSSPLFTNAVTTWDINKLLIVYWSELYDNLMQYPEPPSEDILADDARLDKWLEEKNLLRKSQQGVTMVHRDGKAKTTYHVNEPYRLLTQEEFNQEKAQNGSE